MRKNLSLLHRLWKLEYVQPQLKGESLRSWLGKNLDYALAGQLLDVVMIILSLMLVAIFVWHNWCGLQEADYAWMNVLEYTTGTIFTIDYCVRFYAAEDRIAYTLGPFSIIDILTVLPVWLELVFEALNLPLSGSRKILRPIRVLRALRVLRAYRILNFLGDEVTRKTFIVGLIAVSLILCSSGIFQALEYCEPQLDAFLVDRTTANNDMFNWEDGILRDRYGSSKSDCDSGRSVCQWEATEKLMPGQCPEIMQLDAGDGHGPCQTLTFYDAMYFVIVTITTVGYGDYSPVTDMGRATLMVLILLTAVLVPMKVSELIDAMRASDQFSRSYQPKRNEMFALLTGDVSPNSLNYFLRELFHQEKPDYPLIDKLVILCPDNPSNELRDVMGLPAYETRVRWFRGSAMDDADLRRVKLQSPHCQAVFVMVDKYPDTDNGVSTELNAADMMINLITMSVAGFNRAIPVYAQSTVSVNTRRLLVSGAHAVAAVEELKLNILGMNAMLPGVTTLVSNLLSTIGHGDIVKLSRTFEEMGGNKRCWVHEYLAGTNYEMVRFRVKANLHDVAFRDAARLLFEKCKCTLFAMLDDDTEMEPGKPEQRTVQLFPADRRLYEGDYCYVLAENAYIADEIDKFANAKDLGRKNTAKRRSRNWLGSHDRNSMEEAKKRKSRAGVQRHKNVFKPLCITDLWDKAHAYDETTHHLAVATEAMDTNSAPSEQPNRPKQGLLIDGHELNRPKPLRRRSSFTRSKADLLARMRESESTLSFDEFADGGESCTVAGNTEDWIQQRRRHIVLIGMPSELIDFLLPLRSKHFEKGELRPVVIVSPLAPNHRQYEAASLMPDIYFIRGSPLEETTFVRAACFEAHTVIILANFRATKPSELKDSHMVDADGISVLKFMADTIQKQKSEYNEAKHGEAWELPTIVTEIVQTSNLKYLTYMLEQSKREELADRKRSMDSPTSPIHRVSNLGTINESSLRQAEDLLEKGGSNDYDDELQLMSIADTNLDYMFRPNFASGRVYLSNLSDRLLTKSFFQPQTISVVNTLVNGDGSEEGVRRRLHLLDLPPQMVGRTFKELYDELLQLENPQLCLAILRAASGSGGNPLPYVYTNPDATTVLRAGDRLYVIRSIGVSMRTTNPMMDTKDKAVERRTSGAVVLEGIPAGVSI
jgi:hypothetical protein